MLSIRPVSGAAPNVLVALSSVQHQANRSNLCLLFSDLYRVHGRAVCTVSCRQTPRAKRSQFCLIAPSCGSSRIIGHGGAWFDRCTVPASGSAHSVKGLGTEVLGPVQGDQYLPVQAAERLQHMDAMHHRVHNLL